MELELTDKEAQKFITIIKKILKKYNIDLSKKNYGTISIYSETIKREFVLNYMAKIGEVHLNFADAKTHLTLVRINLDNRFHKNSDGIVRGHRVEIFSEAEFSAKNDGRTQYKAYPLPYKSIKDTDSFYEALESILKYTNTNKNGMLSINTGFQFQ